MPVGFCFYLLAVVENCCCCFYFFRVSPVLYCSVVIVNYSFTGISGCLEFELEVSLVAWIRLGGCCLVYSPILRSRRSQILGFRSLDYQIQEDTRLAILLVKYRSLSYLDYTPLGAQKSCSVYIVIEGFFKYGNLLFQKFPFQ